MSAGEVGFLALVIGCFAVFAVAMVALLWEYARHRARSGPQAAE
jgi:hypothetical protein